MSIKMGLDVGDHPPRSVNSTSLSIPLLMVLAMLRFSANSKTRLSKIETNSILSLNFLSNHTAIKAIANEQRI